ncbi:MAG: peptidylprolyl isomerase [Oligoflexia bacterium]|nr:peptidylprolyl isomerase [Oligoflexia bacterium]
MSKNKKIIILGVTIIFVIIVAAFALLWKKDNINENPSDTTETNQSAESAAPGEIKMSDKYDLTTGSDGLSKATATMTLESGAQIKWKFYTNDAPNTVNRITQLISEGFYNGIVFHRVVPGFVVQAGDPTGTGSGGSGVKLKAEFNSHKHEEGIVSMARTSDPNSADSQFFIMLGKTPHLDGQYTVFGKTIEGYENVQKIRVGDKIQSFIIQ